MMIVDYSSLSRKARRAAQKHAKQLLATTPAAPPVDPTTYASSIRDAINTATMKPKNVEAVLIYADGPVFTADVVYRKGNGFIQIGATEPLPSYKAAENYLRETIAEVKSMTDHPIVISLREQGIDVERLHCLRVRMPNGIRYVIRSEDSVIQESEAFEARLRSSNDPSAESDSQTHEYAAEFARSVVSEYFHRYVDDIGFIKLPDGEPEFCLQLFTEAVSALLAHGVVNIDGGKSDYFDLATLQPTADPDVFEATLDLAELVKA